MHTDIHTPQMSNEIGIAVPVHYAIGVVFHSPPVALVSRPAMS